MIQLTVELGEESFEKSFNSDRVVIGTEGMEGIDVPLPPSSDDGPSFLCDLQLRNGEFWVTVQEGSFSLNGSPLTESTVKEGDLLSIEGARISLDSLREGEDDFLDEELDALIDDVDQLETSPSDEDLEDELEEDAHGEFDLETELARLGELLDLNEDLNALEGPILDPASAPSSEAVEGISDDSLTEETIESLIKEADQLALLAEEAAQEEKTRAIKEASEDELESYLGFDESGADSFLEEEIRKIEETRKEEESQKETQIRQEQEQEIESFSSEGPSAASSPSVSSSLEKATQQNFDDELDDEIDDDDEWEYVEGELEEEELLQVSAWDRWGKKLLGAVAILICSGVILTLSLLVYFRGQNPASELSAARGLADVAMALTQAKREGAVVPEYGWSESDFLISHLSKILPPEYQALSTVDAMGQLRTNHYNLEIITSLNLERFIVIARPQKGIAQDLAPRKTLAIDSVTMEIRQFSHPLFLDRFLSQNGGIDLITEKELAELASTLPSLRPSSLDSGNSKLGFSPPRELSYYLSSEAENKIYNCPRYFLWTEPIVHHLNLLGQNRLGSYDKVSLKEKMTFFSEFPDLVLYTSEGLDVAEGATLAFEKEKMKNVFLIAMVTTEIDSQKILGLSTLDHADYPHYYQLLSEQRTLQSESIARDAALGGTVAANLQRVDKKHPLYISLSELAEQRRETLNDLGEQLIKKIHQHNQKEMDTFYQVESQLLDQYIAVSREYKEKVTKILANLYKEYTNEGSEEQRDLFLTITKETGLDPFLPQELLEKNEDVPSQPNKAFIENRKGIKQIYQSENLEQLHKALLQAAKTIQEVQLLGSGQEVKLQTEVKSAVLDQLSHFLLSPESSVVNQGEEDQNRILLGEILNLAEVSDTMEQEFYLKEFDLLMERFRYLSHDTQRETLHKKENIQRKLSSDEEFSTEYKEKLQGELQELNQDLNENHEVMNQLKSKITQVPLEKTIVYSENPSQRSSKLGQQILIQQSLKAPGDHRDKKLHEAIYLLYNGIDESPGLWGDILEARRLLAETPKNNLLERILKSFPDQSTVTTESSLVREKLKNYITEKKELLMSAGGNNLFYQSSFAAFKSAQRPVLVKIIESTESIQEEFSEIQQSFDEYLVRLKKFHEDYEKARTKRFFLVNQVYHEEMMRKLKKKVQLTKTTQEQLSEFIKEMKTINESFLTLAKQELILLETPIIQNREKLMESGDVSSVLASPKKLPEDLKKELEEALHLDVYPISI